MHANGITEEDFRARIEAAVSRGVDNLAHHQTATGAWCGDYGGPLFLLPMYLALQRIAGRPVPEPRRTRMAGYLLGAQRADGSLGLHIEGEGCMLTTALGYVGLRTLGVQREHPALGRMRGWIRSHGTALAAAPWGKLTLALLNLYGYEGLHPIPPELWLLPPATPFHPRRLWCHARQVYLPMSYLYATRSRVPADSLCLELREDLYDRPYAEIHFAEHRDTVAPEDSYRPASPLLNAANRLLLAYEGLHSPELGERALDEVVRHMDYEDRATSSIRLGPVNAVLNTACLCFRAPGTEALRRSLEQLDGYLCDGPDGVMMNGYNSTELWDTVMAIQAILATPFAPGQSAALARGQAFVRDNQILEDLPEAVPHYRHPSRGGWPFSNRPHGWPVADCTAEALKVALSLEDRVEDPVPTELLEAAVALVLSFQNRDGGWATYERVRGGAWLELLLNPSQVFGDIMVERSYPECTSSCVQALVAARARFPDLQARIDRAVRRGADFLRASQRKDGSWEGSWGVCFTYGTWFGISGLVAAGARPGDPAIGRAVRFLLDRQKPDGGWGEHHRSCSERRYVEHPESQAVMTSWALSALCRARCRDRWALRRAAAFLLARQDEDGGWPREAIAGVFNRTCMIDYDNYRHYFPVRALGEWLGLEVGA